IHGIASLHRCVPKIYRGQGNVRQTRGRVGYKIAALNSPAVGRVAGVKKVADNTAGAKVDCGAGVSAISPALRCVNFSVNRPIVHSDRVGRDRKAYHVAVGAGFGWVVKAIRAVNVGGGETVCEYGTAPEVDRGCG